MLKDEVDKGTSVSILSPQGSGNTAEEESRKRVRPSGQG